MGTPNLCIGEGAKDNQHHRAFSQLAWARHRDQQNLCANNIGDTKKHRKEHTKATDQKDD